MKVILSNVRLAFPDLFDPKQYQGKGDFSYGCQLLVDPESQAFADIEAALEEVATAKWGKKAKAMMAEIRPDKKACCWIDGNRRSDYDGFAGMWSLTAKRSEKKGPPMVLTRGKKLIQKDTGQVYGGCFVDASVDIYASESGGVGLRCELSAIRFFGDGEAFGSGSAPTADDFADLADGAGDDEHDDF